MNPLSKTLNQTFGEKKEIVGLIGQLERAERKK